ncbi:MAG: preprotein translocase subunit SecG [Candidatus Gracilibacteria bacterium]|jgi:protein translocase SecG subunit|nr:preprotein translocase subunit SecG [Candidatus Gracilibacteria bacterium]
MKTALSIIQILLSMSLIAVILLQQRSEGLSATFGGSGGFHVAKRGAEKILFNVTLVISVLFIVNSLAFLFV